MRLHGSFFFTDMKQALLLILFSCTICKAQFTTEFNPLTITGNASNLKTEIPLAAPKTVGSSYLSDAWIPGRIVLRNQHTLPAFDIRIEVEQELIEIRSENVIRYVNIRDIRQVTMTGKFQNYYNVIENAAMFKIEGSPLSGVVLTDTSTGLKVVKQMYIEVIPSNYNVALDVGSRDNRKMLRERLFLSIDNELIQCKQPVKKLLQKLGKYEPKARTVLKEHRLNLSKEEDLQQFVALLKV